MSTEISSTQNSSTDGPTQAQRFIKPYYEVSGSDESYEVRVTMPGVAKDGVGLTLEKKELTIEGHRSFTLPKGTKALHREIPRADFRLRLQLNVEIEEDAIQAKTEQGILSIQLPVATAAKPRTIQVN